MRYQNENPSKRLTNHASIAIDINESASLRFSTQSHVWGMLGSPRLVRYPSIHPSFQAFSTISGRRWARRGIPLRSISLMTSSIRILFVAARGIRFFMGALVTLFVVSWLCGAMEGRGGCYRVLGAGERAVRGYRNISGFEYVV